MAHTPAMILGELLVRLQEHGATSGTGADPNLWLLTAGLPAGTFYSIYSLDAILRYLGQFGTATGAVWLKEWCSPRNPCPVLAIQLSQLSRLSASIGLDAASPIFRLALPVSLCCIHRPAVFVSVYCSYSALCAVQPGSSLSLEAMLEVLLVHYRWGASYYASLFDPWDLPSLEDLDDNCDRSSHSGSSVGVFGSRTFQPGATAWACALCRPGLPCPLCEVD